MTKSKTTKRALLSSVMALLLCVSMMLGTTFAWFTDEVVSANNVIASGTLDVELNWKEKVSDEWKDASEGAIFDYEHWEPGYTEVRYVQIANVGTLAFKYQLNIIPNILPADGTYNLADVIEVRLITAADAEGKTREELLKVAPVGTLSSLMNESDGAAHGIMLPAEDMGSEDFTLNPEDVAEIGSVEYCIVLHMQESAGNEYQGLSVGKGFSVQLLATQYTYENDSFDNMYDEDADYGAAPVANVTVFQPKMIKTSNCGEILLEAGFQFMPTETEEEALESPYRWWHADFVVSADRDIPAEAVILPGYYSAYCDDYNNGQWIGLYSDGVIPAGEQIRLIEAMGGGSITVNYKEICKWGNDNTGFLCGVSVDPDQRAAVAGTTITVELRVYEVENADSDSGSHNVEVVPENYKTIGTYTYTIPANAPSIPADDYTSLSLALGTNNDATLTANVQLTDELVMNGSTLDGAGYVLERTNSEPATNSTNYGLDVNGGTIQNITITGKSMVYGDTTYGFRAVYSDSADEDIVINNAVLSGTYALNVTSPVDGITLTVTNTTLQGWVSGGLNGGNYFDNCKFEEGPTGYKTLRIYNDFTLTNCSFVSGMEISAGSASVTGKTLTLNNCTINGTKITAGNFVELFGSDSTYWTYLTSNTVIVDGVTVTW